MPRNPAASGQFETAPTGNLPFQLLEVESTYSVIDEVKHRYFRRDLAKLKYDARFYERRYRWSGSSPEGQEPPSVLSSTDGIAHRLHGPVIRENDNAIFQVDLGQTLAAKRKIEIVTEHLLFDEAGSFQPYFRHRVTEPTGKLTLQVQLPTDLFSNVQPFFMAFQTSARHSVPKSLVVEADDPEAGIYRISANKPRVGFVYGIEWL